MKIKYFILLFVFIPLLGLSYEGNSNKIYKNRRSKYPVGINIIAFGPTRIAGVSFDWFMLPKVNIEMGAGITNLKTFRPSYFAGAKYHFFGNTILNTTFYLGLFDNITLDSTLLNQQLYVPFGIQRIKKNKLTWNIEVAYTYNISTFQSQVWGAFKLGYRFNRFDKKNKKPSNNLLDFKKS